MAKTKTKTKAGTGTAVAEAPPKHTGKKGRLAKRKPEAYDSQIHGKQEGRVPNDDYCINQSVCTINVMRPQYKEGPMIFVPFKHPDYDDPENNLQPGRTKPEPGAYTHWIMRIMCCAFAGTDQKATMCLWKPGDKAGKSGNPFRILKAAAEQAHDAGEFGNGKAFNSKWNRLLKGSKKGGAALDFAKPKFFIQGAVFRNGDTAYIDDDRELPMGLGPNDDLVLIELPPSASGIMSIFDKELDAYDGDADTDPSLPFVHGDPTGRFSRKKRIITDLPVFRIFNPKLTKYKAGENGIIDTSWDGTIKKIQGYEAAISAKFRQDKQTHFDGTIQKPQVDKIFSLLQYWFDDPDSGSKGILRIPSIEEQCAVLARAYKSVSALLKFAWYENPEFMTDEVKGILGSKVSAVIPGKTEEDDEDDDEEDDDETPRARKKKTRKDPTAPASDEDDEDDDEEGEDDEDEADDDEESDDDADDEEDKEEDKEEDDDEESDDDESDDDEESDEKDEKDDDEEEDEESDEEADDEEDDDAESDDEEEEDEESDDDEEDDADDDDADGEDEESDDDADDESDDDEEEEEDEFAQSKPPKKGDKKKGDKKPAGKTDKSKGDYFPEPSGKKKGDKAKTTAALSAAEKAGKSSKNRGTPPATPPPKQSSKGDKKPKGKTAETAAPPPADKPKGKKTGTAAKGGSAKRKTK